MDDVELTLRLLMDHKEASQVLGRKASNMTSLRDETGSKIIMSNRQYKHRVLSITDTKKQVMKAIKRLSEILESEMNSYGTSKRIVPISLTLIIPKNIGGMIVGKGGESIKDLRVNSGAQIAFSSECLPHCDERSCKLTGNTFAVVTGIELIVEKLIEAAIQESKGEFKGTPSNQIVPYDPSKDTGEPKRDEKDEKVVNLAGAFLAASNALESSSDYIPIEIDDQTQELRVPEDHIGAIIGKGGKRINEVRSLSGCRVKIEREDGSGVRRITLIGEKKKIVMATYLINQSISSFSTAKPVNEKLGVTVRGTKEYKTDINNLSSDTMGGHEEQVAAAMTAFFAQQFSAVPKMDPLNPNEYDPEASNKSYKPTLEYVDNPFADNKMPPDMYTVPDKKPRLHY